MRPTRAAWDEIGVVRLDHPVVDHLDPEQAGAVFRLLNESGWRGRLDADSLGD